MSSKADELLKRLSEANSVDKSVTTSLDSRALALIEPYRAGRSIRATVLELLEIADEALKAAERVKRSKDQASAH